MTVTVIFGPGVDAAINALIDYVDIDSIPTVVNFLDDIQKRLVNTLSTFPSGGERFQGKVRTHVVKGYVFLFEYRADIKEVHVLDMIAPGRNWK